MASFKDVILGTFGIPATCTITSDESEFTDATPFEIQIVFDKSVTGFVVGDITITHGSLSNFAGSGTSYTADVTPALTDDITIQVAADVTVEGNSASNTVTVTDNYVVPGLTAYAIRYRDVTSGTEWNETDFDDQTNFNNSTITNGYELDAVGDAGRSLGTNLLFTPVTIASQLEMSLHREFVSLTGMDAVDNISGSNVTPFQFFNFGFVFDVTKDTLQLTTGNTRQYSASALTSDKAVVVAIGRGPTFGNVVVCVSKSGTGAGNRSETSYEHGNVSDLQDSDFKVELTKGATNWVAKAYLDDVEIISHTTQIPHAGTTTAMGIIHHCAYTATTQSVERVTAIKRTTT